jgi:hypothetical protein
MKWITLAAIAEVLTIGLTWSTRSNYFTYTPRVELVRACNSIVPWLFEDLVKSM